MRLQSVRIKRFRSIKNEVVDQCGDFNVLIGKNNSGKSNVMSAISAFFMCAGSANVVSLNPPNGREIDFFDKKTDKPIEIQLRLELSELEKTNLLSNIVAEAPQMKNAVDGFAASLVLDAVVKIMPPPVAFAVVSNISLTDIAGATQHTLLSVGSQPATELRDKAIESSLVSRDVDSLQSVLRYFDQEFWDRFSQRGGGSPTEWRYYFPARSISDMRPKAANAVEELIRTSPSFAEFQEGLRSLIAETDKQVEVVLNQPLANKVETFAGEEPSVPVYILDLLRAMSRVKVLYLREYRRPIGKGEAKQLLSLKVRRGGTEALRNIQDTVNNLLGVHIDAFESSTSPVRAETEAELDVDNFLVEVNGSGVREALRLILDVEFEHPSILMVEEPETHLHPALEISMMHYLKRVSSKIQVFVTTHSTNFLDTAEMKNVYLVSKNESTQIQLLNYAEAESQIPKELGLRLSSIFMFDRLVFVEGPSDEGAFREWASTLRVNFSQSNVGFVTMGGVRNFTHYAAEATLAFLTKRQIGIWFILDRDEREEAEIESLEQLFDGKASVKILDRREVENYMISARVIREFIKAKKAASGKGKDDELPTEAEILEALDTTAEELKQLTVEKRVAKVLCKPVYPSTKELFDAKKKTPFRDRVGEELNKMSTELERVRNQLESEFLAQEQSIAARWDTQKLALVPGDELLDKVCQKYGVRFKKERDSTRLAALMSDAEIDNSIKNIIREIGGIAGPVN